MQNNCRFDVSLQRENLTEWNVADFVNLANKMNCSFPASYWHIKSLPPMRIWRTVIFDRLLSPFRVSIKK